MFREKGREGDREGEKHRCVRGHPPVASRMRSDWGLHPQARHVADWESHGWPFALWKDIQPTEQQWSRPIIKFLKRILKKLHLVFVMCQCLCWGCMYINSQTALSHRSVNITPCYSWWNWKRETSPNLSTVTPLVIQWQRQDSNSGSLAPMFSLLITNLICIQRTHIKTIVPVICSSN